MQQAARIPFNGNREMFNGICPYFLQAYHFCIKTDYWFSQPILSSEQEYWFVMRYPDVKWYLSLFPSYFPYIAILVSMCLEYFICIVTLSPPQLQSLTFCSER